MNELTRIDVVEVPDRFYLKVSAAARTWRDLQERLRLRGDPCVQLKVFSETYLNSYAKVRNKKRSWQRKQTSFNMINKFMGKVQIRAINAGLLHSYVQWRKKRGASDATINRDLTIVKHILNYAVECKILRNNPVEKFRNLNEELKERQQFTEEQIQKVIGAVNPLRRPVFSFIRETGRRREEALSLKWGQRSSQARCLQRRHEVAEVPLCAAHRGGNRRDSRAAAAGRVSVRVLRPGDRGTPEGVSKGLGAGPREGGRSRAAGEGFAPRLRHSPRRSRRRYARHPTGPRPFQRRDDRRGEGEPGENCLSGNKTETCSRRNREAERTGSGPAC